MFGPTYTALPSEAPASQLSDLEETADMLLKMVTVQVQQRQRPVTYSLDVMQAVAVRAFKQQFAAFQQQRGLSASQSCQLEDSMHSLDSDIRSGSVQMILVATVEPSIASVEALQAQGQSAEPVSEQIDTSHTQTAPSSSPTPESAAAAGSEPPLAESPVASTTCKEAIASKAEPSAVPSECSPDPRDESGPVTRIISVLTAMANSGLHELKGRNMYQQHWPTPTAATWEDSVTVAIRVASALEWTDSQMRRRRAPADRIVMQRHRSLANSLLEMLQILLAGHIPDLSVDVGLLYDNLFHVVMGLWPCTQTMHRPNLSQLPIPITCNSAAQLGRSMLKRLASDASLAKRLCQHGHDGQAWQTVGAVSGVKSMLKLICTYPQSLGTVCLPTQ